jgi:hypothetical protein
MKIASARIPRRFLLALLIIFAGMPLPSQLTIQAKSPLPASSKELNPESGAAQRPVPTQTPAGQADMSSQANWRFQVEEGKSKRESITLDHRCPTPKLLRIKSDKKFFQFEAPTDSVLFQPGSNIFTVLIDATGLKEGVHRVKLDVECLNCKEEPKCPQVASKLVVEITVTKQSSQTPQGNPQNAPSLPTLPSQATQGDKEVQELSINGPQFPATLNLSDLKFKALVKGNWPLFLDYELEQPGHVILIITLKKKLPYVYMFPEMSPGRHEKLITLPAYLGNGPLVATYSIRAVSERMFGLVPLVIHAFAVGDEAVGSSGLDSVKFEPRNVRIVGGRPASNATYSFRAIRPFSGGANADIRRINGSSAVMVSAQPYNRRIGRDETIIGVWDCKRGRTPSRGKHKLFVKAWFTVQNGGSSAFAFSPSLVDIQ